MEADVLEEPRWDAISSSQSALYPWAKESTYVRLPSFFEGIEAEPAPIENDKPSRKTRNIAWEEILPADGNSHLKHRV